MKFTSVLASLAIAVPAMANNWATYPSVAKTQSVNGFDPINSLLPECAQECPHYDTDNTPCPYWDTGCLCVMPQWSGAVAECFIESCSGDDLEKATSLAYSLCTKVGANVWMMPSSISSALSAAVAEGETDAETTTESQASETGETTSETGTTTAGNLTSSGSSSSSTTASEDSSSTASSGSRMIGYSLMAAVMLPLLSMM